MHLPLKTALALLLTAYLPFALIVIAAPQTDTTGRPLALQTSSEMVLVPVTVTDHYGKNLGGLKAENFTSMRDLLGTAKQIVHAFLGTANPSDEFRLLTVSTQPEAVSGFTTDAEELENSVQFTRSAGLTALIDTVYLGLNQMRQARHPRRALLVLSDGLDNHSQYSKNELMRVALEADVQVYAIIFDNNASASSSSTVPYRPAMIAKPGDQGQHSEGRDLLETLAEKTGGLHFRVHNGSETKDAATQIGAAVRHEYVIGYHPPHSGPSGKWHRIRVKADLPNVSVYARSGYYSR
jgi:Ca-activated chloride channel family protein